MKVKFKKLNEKAVLPQYAHDTDAGLDLVCVNHYPDDCGNIVYYTGLAVEIPEGYVGLLFPRSSISKKSLLLSNAVGVIDSGYRGEIMAKFKPQMMYNGEGWEGVELNDGNMYNFGDRIVQLIIMPYPHIEPEWADELTATDRGEGGYGSTGK